MSWNYFVFAFVLYVACGAVAFRLKRRKYFWVKLTGSTIAYFLFAFLWSYFELSLNIGWFQFVFLIYEILCILMIWLCFKIHLAHAIFYATIAYTVEHISSRILGLFDLFITIKPNYEIWIRLTTGIMITALIWSLFIRREQIRMNADSFLLPKSSTIIISGVTVLFIYVLSMYADSVRFETDKILSNLSTLGCGVLLLFVQLGVFEHSKVESEKLAISRAMEEEREQYKLSQENIEKINIKCHDLKHRIDRLRNADDKCRDEEIKELESLLKIYEAGFRTGNSALDEVLTKKALQCIDLNIKLMPIIDGNAVSVIKDDDIDSLFGNILDNAIEYLASVSDEELRIVSLKITNKNKFLIIHTENYCSTPLQFKGGLPVTTKPDKDNHGFGMTSIGYIVKKYKGTLSVKQEDENYVLNIIIPI